MTTEGVQIHDGGNTVAAANYYNPTSALSGPNGSGQFLAVQLSTSADRTSLLVSSGGVAIYGILQNTPAQGDAADVCLFGLTKAVGGAAITRGASLMVDSSGRLVTATSTNVIVGYAVESCSGANDIFLAFITNGSYPHA